MSEPQTGDGPFAWKVHPFFDERPVKSLSLLAIIIFVTLVAALSFGHYLYGAFSLAVLVASLSKYLFPSYYTLNCTGFQCRHLGRLHVRRWTEFRRVDTRLNGLFLSPFARSSRLDSFRGFFLPFHQNRDAVVYYVRRHVDTRTN